MKNKADGASRGLSVLIVVLLVVMLLAPIPISIVLLSKDYEAGHNSEIQSILLEYIQEPAIRSKLVYNGGESTADNLNSLNSAKYGAKQYQYYIVGMALDYGECLIALDNYSAIKTPHELDKAKEILSRFQNYQSRLKEVKPAAMVYPELLELQQSYIESITAELEYIESSGHTQHSPGEHAAELLILSNKVEDSRNTWVSQLTLDIGACLIAGILYLAVGILAIRSVMKSFKIKKQADEEMAEAKRYEAAQTRGGA